MIDAYRGTSLHQLKVNFENGRLYNNTKTKNFLMYCGEDLETAIKFSGKVNESGLTIVLELNVPDKFRKPGNEIDIIEYEQRDEFVMAYNQKNDGEYECPYIPLKYLVAIHEFKGSPSSLSEFKNKGNHFYFKGSPKQKVDKFKKYVKKRTET